MIIAVSALLIIILFLCSVRSEFKTKLSKNFSSIPEANQIGSTSQALDGVGIATQLSTESKKMTPLSDFATLADAKAYEATRERVIPLTQVLRLLSVTGSDALLFASTDAKAKSFLLAIQSGVQEWDCRNSSAQGAELQGLLTYLVSVGGVNEAFRTGVIDFCNNTYSPYENVTEYEFAQAKGDVIPQVTLTRTTDGYLIIQTNGDCESHRPKVYKQIGSKRVHIATFGAVETVDEYHITIGKNQGTTFFVDDHYGVIEAA